MSTKKKVATPTRPRVDLSDELPPEAYQNIKGVMYVRPLIYTIMPDGSMGWRYAVESYPDIPTKNG